MEVAGIAHVIAILVRSIDWKDAPFGWCQVLPANGKFISLWSKRDEAYFNIIQDIKEVVREARDRQTTREVNREKFSPPPNKTNVKTIMPPLAALKVNRQTDDLKIERHTDDLKRNRQTDELVQQKRLIRARTESQVLADEIAVPEFTLTPLKRTLPKARRKRRTAVAQNSTKQRSLEFKKWRELSSKELEKVSKGNHGIFLLLFLIFDVFGIPAAILGWSGSWGLFGLAFCISLPIFVYGIMNIYNLLAIPLALLFAGAWEVIIHHYVSWHLLIVIGIFTLIACSHFLLFRRHIR